MSWGGSGQCGTLWTRPVVGTRSLRRNAMDAGRYTHVDTSKLLS